MVQAEKPQSTETQQFEQQQHLISMSNNVAKDLLQSFMIGNHLNIKLHEATEEEEEEDVELSLGLSLNGRFGVDPRAKKLTRSSSIPDFINPKRENGSAFVVPMVSTNLMRTCSLPTETEEEWRKRKELQTLRRMEAKRKRSEKQRCLKAMKDGNRGPREEINGEEDKNENGILGNWNFNGLVGASIEGLSPPALMAAPLLQRSIGSQGSRSSGTSESVSQPVQGINKCSEARSPSSIQSMSDCEQKLSFAPGSTNIEKSGRPAGVQNNGSDKSSTSENRAKEMLKSVLYDMPCVSTKGDGPNGKRIEGFLYRYRKGEEPRIVCVCHGSFLSPAEFVKHAGGGDVAEPLKHIVVSPSLLL